MKRHLLLFLTASLVLAGCVKYADYEELSDRVDRLEANSIVPVSGQIAAISSSIEALQTAKGLIDKQLEELDGADAALETGSSQLGEAIEELRTHVGELVAGNKTWAEATFATLDVMSDVLTRLGALETSVPALEQTLPPIETSIKKWVGVQLEGYVTLTKFQNSLSTLEESIGSDVEGLRSELKAAKTQLTSDYKAAIGKALTAYGGEVTEEIATAISTATETAVGGLEEKISALETAMNSLIGRIQSIVVVPAYMDGSVKLNPTGSSTVRFEISPAETAAALVGTEDAALFFHFQAVCAQGGTASEESPFIGFVVESVSMSASGNFVEVTVSPAAPLPSGTDMMARLKIEANADKAGYVCKTSDYFLIFE